MFLPLSSFEPPATIGLVGFGAFGRLIARALSAYVSFLVHDPAFPADRPSDVSGVTFADLEQVARCPIVVLATPVASLAEVVRAIAPHLSAGALVIDVGSVKILPARIMLEELPDTVEIVATHPLFGPQSARGGLQGLKIALCDLRGRRGRRIGAFLRAALGLDVIFTTPDEHDREAATAQGLTHLIAKILVRMEPLPTRMTTRSFDMIMQAVEMVRDDAPAVYDAIERLNPHAASVRRRFLGLAAELEAEFADRSADRHDGAPEFVAGDEGVPA